MTDQVVSAGGAPAPIPCAGEGTEARRTLRSGHEGTQGKTEPRVTVGPQVATPAAAIKSPRKTKPPKPDRAPELSSRDIERLDNALRRFVCSEPWLNFLHSGILYGRLPYRPQAAAQEKQLRRVAAYPPGGLMTAMRRCTTCRRWYPPQTIGSGGECIECFYEGLPIEWAVRIPGSNFRLISGNVAGHFEGAGYRLGRHGGTEDLAVGARRHEGEADQEPAAWMERDGEAVSRCRYLGDDGHVHEPFVNDRGFVEEFVYTAEDLAEARQRQANQAIDGTSEQPN
jgi:hypothetical protein